MKKWKNKLILLLFSSLIALMLWITLLSRIGADSRSLYPPFWSYRAIVNGSHRILLEVVGNVLLFVPVGLIAAVVLHFRLWQTIVLGFSLSLLIECSQWFFWIGAFEIDDIVHNTLGAGIGAFLSYKTGIGKLLRLTQNNRTKHALYIILIVSGFTSVPFLYEASDSHAMKEYAAINDREDGAKNLLILNGESGYVGPSDVYVDYPKSSVIHT